MMIDDDNVELAPRVRKSSENSQDLLGHPCGRMPPAAVFP